MPGNGACFLPNASSMATVITPLAIAIIHERDVVCRMVRLLGRQSGCIAGGIDPVERRLHPAAVRQASNRARTCCPDCSDKVRPLRQRHRAVTGTDFISLIDHRHCGASIAASGTIEDQPPAGAGKKPEDHRVVAEKKFF